MNNYKKDQRKIDLENINEINIEDRYKKVDEVIMFDSETTDTIQKVYLILARTTTTSSSTTSSSARILQESDSKVYFSEIRLNDELGKESKIVWWIYFVLALIAITMLLILGLLIASCFTKEEEEYMTPLPNESNKSNKTEDSSLSKTEENFETEPGKLVPSELDNNYINPSKSQVE